MKILYYDCFSGISGDMNLGAMIDLGVGKEYLINELSKLNLDSEYEIRIRRENKKGIDGTKVDVILKNKHDHSHDHHDHTHSHSHSHAHRNLKDIEYIINSSSLNENVKKLSIDMFRKIAQAEAKVHGKSLYEVHFHEVGAVDSIVDIVGAAICIDYLKVDKIMASHVQLGGGFVKCAHGLIPVPAPATVEILKGIPIKSGIAPFETTTPTGAAILAVNVDEFTDEMNFTIEKIGYGIGSRDLKIPNVLRVYIARENEEKKTESNSYIKQYILETNIDDMNPEIYSYIEEKLFDKGALDVFKTPIIMKKGRIAVKLSVLVREKDIKAIQEVIFKETTSIGIRKYEVEKIMLERDFSKVSTNYGEVTVKNSYYKGEKIKFKPEYEDCRRLAVENNIPIGEIYKEVYNKIGGASNDK
ncbi:hypothetical protein TR13x_05855 [Caloranaerobacter sp. TR13]|uniref:nickel pincer cofactor biosynthesis protein LarC n=1 Tax=Caloranaerobacter sp. TR13 TaxID=1302151 RepID=UPI0006D3B7B6|nr:nickel pincer cofactor biosynthesis protein LarC [Caloranaerobacter sp. TR13]KPU27271.1 hypothetical protein TR13x_05855 [Caloranaerobacter sp. TR13]